MSELSQVLKTNVTATLKVSDILAVIVQNAPAEIQAVEQIFAWAQKTYVNFMATLAQPADQVTAAQLLAHLDTMAATDERIQAE